MAVKSRILIADDAEINRMMLSEILGDKYDFLYACDGVEAIEIIGSNEQVDLVLLDVNMPNMGGFDVLRIMNEQHWIRDLPVIIISAEDSVEFIREAYALGVTDYINRPFNSIVVERRVENTLLMYANQRRLIHLVEDQIYEREKINSSMINIFSNIIEMRNRESGRHTINVQGITNMLLLRLTKITDKYELSKADISLITSLSALHDIGKIKIPEGVLNKPGKLTPEEWELMKTHTIEGDLILSSSELDQKSKFVRTARSICRWHHEKFDGKGYPDGLIGDEIPIAAQVVSMADCYDALTSERCYKPPFPHEQAMKMLTGGECGAFNPLLLQCLHDVSDELRALVQSGQHYDFEGEIVDLADELLADGDLPQQNVMRHMYENERRKKEFFMENSDGIQFEYDKLLHKATLVNLHNSDPTKRKIMFTDRGNPDSILPDEYWDLLRSLLINATRESPIVEADVKLRIDGAISPYHARLLALWADDTATDYVALVGSFTPTEK